MSANGIAHLATKELRQKAKLDLAASNRATSNNARSTYDLTELPTQYADNSIVDNPNGSGLIAGRPWINTVAPFTFYEAFGTTSALETTCYVSGNKIYVYSSSYDVPSYQNARVVVNDIEVLSVGNGHRGHNAVVLNSYGDVEATYTFDTYNDPITNSAALTAALAAVPSGYIVVLTVYDASALTAEVRTAINTGYGSTTVSYTHLRAHETG
jgi:hypothetical protein